MQVALITYQQISTGSTRTQRVEVLPGETNEHVAWVRGLQLNCAMAGWLGNDTHVVRTSFYNPKPAGAHNG